MDTNQNHNTDEAQAIREVFSATLADRGAIHLVENDFVSIPLERKVTVFGLKSKADAIVAHATLADRGAIHLVENDFVSIPLERKVTVFGLKSKADAIVALKLELTGSRLTAKLADHYSSSLEPSVISRAH